MLDEEKVVDAEVVETEPVNEAPVATPAADEPQAKAALAAFIMSIIGFCFAWEPVGSVVGIILGAIALGKTRAAAGVVRKPHAVFNKIAKPLAIVSLIAGIVMTIVWFIVLIVWAVGVAAGVVAGGMGA